MIKIEMSAEYWEKNWYGKYMGLKEYAQISL
jgi:hypothetical protein